MADAKRDSNRVPSMLGVSSSDLSTPTKVAVDPTTNRLKVDAAYTAAGNSSAGSGNQTIVTAGTAVQLESDTSCVRVFVQALETNSGVVVVGDSNVDAAEGSRRGLALYAGQGDWFNVSNLNLLYIDSTQSGDKVHYYYES